MTLTRAQLAAAPVPAEPARSADLRALMPKFAAVVAEALNRCWLAGLDPVVFEAVRSAERQRYLYGIGRQYTPKGYTVGQTVTNVADARYGWHLYGGAVDVISRKTARDDPAFFARCAPHFRAAGAKWGGDWVGFVDRPHFYFGTMKDKPSDHARALYASGGLRAVWAEVGGL